MSHQVPRKLYSFAGGPRKQAFGRDRCGTLPISHLSQRSRASNQDSGLRKISQILPFSWFRKLLYLPFASHLHTFITLFTIQYLCKKLINTGCIRSGLRTRNPGTPPELGSRPRGEVVVTIPADLSASWFASAPAELVQSQPQRPSADWGRRRLGKKESISDHLHQSKDLIPNDQGLNSWQI